MPFSSDPAEMRLGYRGPAAVLAFPGTVLYPHQTLPLQITDDAGCQLIQHALAGNRMLAVAHLRPVAVGNGQKVRSDCYPMVSLANILAEELLSQGGYHLILQGMHRAVIQAELDQATAYRVVQVQSVSDHLPRMEFAHRRLRRRELLDEFRRHFSPHQSDAIVAQLDDADLPLGALCDFLASACPLAPAMQQKLFEELDVDRRCQLLVQQLSQLATCDIDYPEMTYPPLISLN